MRRFLALFLVVLAASPGCLVLALDRFYNEPSIVFDERLIGTWQDKDDNVTVTVERSDWRAYRLHYTHPIDTRVLSGYLFKVKDVFFLDLSPLRGEDAGPFLLPAHSVVRLSIAAGEIAVSALDFDWFVEALGKQALPAYLKAARGERNQVVLAAERAALVKWLAGRPDKDPAFAEPAIFRKNPER